MRLALSFSSQNQINDSIQQATITTTNNDIFKDAGLSDYFYKSYGWVIFKNIGEVGWGIGGGGGKGQVFCKTTDNGPAQLVGTASLVQLSVGFQFGAQVTSQIIFFETREDFEEFAEGNVEFQAEAQVTALTAGAAAKASTAGNSCGYSWSLKDVRLQDCGCTNGIAAFLITKGGLMCEASVGGQKFGCAPRLEQPVQACQPLPQEDAPLVKTIAQCVNQVL